MSALLLILASVAFGGLRLAGVTHVAFQAFAHLWVGGLIGAGCARARTRRRDWGLAVALTVLEIVAVLLTRVWPVL